MASARKLFERRKRRVRNTLRKKSTGRPRLSIFRSGKHIYAQVIDDVAGVTIASASTLDKDTGEPEKRGWTQGAASAVGKRVAERAINQGIKTVVFDRGGYMFHGRVKALADAAREAGLDF